MTIHQLTHAAGIEFELRPADLVARLGAAFKAFRAARRLEREMEMLDHREIADLAFRR